MASYPLTIKRKPLPSVDYVRVPDEQFSTITDGADGKEEMSLRKYSPALAFFQWWLPEIFASMLSVVSLLFLVVLLRHYEGRGIHDLNLPSSLTLNGLVAILSTLIRVSIMVPIGSAISQEVWLWLLKSRKDCGRLQNLEFSDAASRGAWGSLIFLIRARTSWPACSGALVTIISLGFGTFTQQLLALKAFPVAQTLNPPSVPRTEGWFGVVGNAADDAMLIPLDLKAAIWNGILNGNLTPLNVPCPTGNCTWPTTPSMAVCGACSNTTYQQSCNFTNDAELDATPLGESVPQFRIKTVCQDTMPSGMVANLTNLAEKGGSAWGTSFQVMQSPGAIYKKNDNRRLYISNFEVVGSTATTLSASWSNSSTVASECALWMCVQAFETNMLNSNQTQIVTEEFPSIDDSHAWNFTDVMDNGYTFLDIPSTMNPRSNAKYKVDFDARTSLHAYLEPMFNGSVYLNDESTLPSSDVIDAMFSQARNLDEWMKNVATSMTNAIRSEKTNQIQLGFTKGEQDEVYKGIGFQLGYEVRWPWIVVPAALVAWSLMICVATIFRTAISPIRAWKGSPLAILFMDVDPKMRKDAAGQMDVCNGLVKSVGKTKVVMEADCEGNWSLKRA